MTIKLFVGLILLAIIALGVSIMTGLYHVGRLIFKKDERRESLKGAAKMGALFIISYAFLNGIWFNIKQPGMWTNIYPNDIKANIKLSTQDKTIDANDTVSHDDIDNLVRKKTIWPSHVTIEATNTKGQTLEFVVLYPLVWQRLSNPLLYQVCKLHAVPMVWKRKQKVDALLILWV